MSKLGYKFSEESKQKMRDAWSRRRLTPVSDETREKMRQSNKGRENAVKSREKIRISKLGEKNPMWRGGVTPKNLLIRASADYRLWREAVFIRDNYTCVWCGSRNGEGKAIILHADHIKQFAYYPELRFAIDNGRTLCKECHKTTETYAKYIK